MTFLWPLLEFLFCPFSWDLDTRRKYRVSSLYFLQQPPFIPVGFGKSQEYVGKNKGLVEGEIEKFGEGNILLHSVFICHMTVSPLCLYINFSHLSWSFPHSALFSGLIILHLSKVHLFYWKLSKSVSECLFHFYKWNHISTFNYQGYLVEEKDSQVNLES